MPTNSAAANCTVGSSSRIVSTAIFFGPSAAPPPGFDRVRFTVSGPSPSLSLTIGTRNVRLDTPAPKVSVPLVAA